MVDEFDKEMELLLRGTAQSETVSNFEAESDLDADEINAFLENLLPPKARVRIAAKLADSPHGRAILANAVLLNEAAETEETKSFASTAQVVQEAEKKTWSAVFAELFTPKILGLTGASLAVVLVGTFALIMFSGNQSSEIAQTTGKSEATKNELPAATPVADVNAASVTSNAASAAAPLVNSAANASANIAPVAANTAVATKIPSIGKGPNTPIDAPKEEVIEENPARNNADNAKSVDKDVPAIVGEKMTDAAPKPVSAAPMTATTPGAVSLDEAKSRERESVVQPDDVDMAQSEAKKKTAPETTTPSSGPSKNTQFQVPPLPRKGPMQNQRRDGGNYSNNDITPSETPEMRQVGGKNFTKRGNTWVDVAYGSQKTKRISRGSKDYQKLDAGLRSIAENLSGEVLVVWNGKAYRIN